MWNGFLVYSYFIINLLTCSLLHAIYIHIYGSIVTVDWCKSIFYLVTEILLNHFTFWFCVLCVHCILLFAVQIEMMSEAIDETLDKDEAEEETEELTNQVQYLKHKFLLSFLS